MNIAYRWIKIKNGGALTAEAAALEGIGAYSPLTHMGKIEDITAQDGDKYTFYFVPVDGMPGRVAVYSRKKTGPAQYIKIGFSSTENLSGGTPVSVSFVGDKNDTTVDGSGHPKLTGGRDTITFDLGDPKTDALNAALKDPSVAFSREIARNTSTALVNFEKVNLSTRFVTLCRNVGGFIRAHGKTFIIVAASALVIGATILGTALGLNNDAKNWRDYSTVPVVAQYVDSSLDLDGKILSAPTESTGAMLSLTDPCIIPEKPLDALKGSEISKSAGTNMFTGKRAYGIVNAEARVENLARALATWTVEQYKASGVEFSATEVEYPVSINHQDSSSSDGLYQFLDAARIQGEDGKLVPLSQSEKNAVVSTYETYWVEEATKAVEAGMHANAQAQAIASAQAAAEASAKASIDAAVRSGFSATIGDYKINWETGEFVAWSPDEAREYRYSGQSDVLKGIDFETMTQEEIQEKVAAAFDGAQIKQSQKLEAALGDLFESETYNGKKATFERKLAEQKASMAIRTNCDHTEYYVDVDSMTFTDGRMQVTVEIDCFTKNSDTGAYEYRSSTETKGETVFAMGSRTPDVRAGMAASVVSGVTLNGIGRDKSANK